MSQKVCSIDGNVGVLDFRNVANTMSCIRKSIEDSRLAREDIHRLLVEPVVVPCDCPVVSNFSPDEPCRRCDRRLGLRRQVADLEDTHNEYPPETPWLKLAAKPDFYLCCSSGSRYWCWVVRRYVKVGHGPHRWRASCLRLWYRERRWLFALVVESEIDNRLEARHERRGCTRGQALLGAGQWKPGRDRGDAPAATCLRTRKGTDRRSSACQNERQPDKDQLREVKLPLERSGCGRGKKQGSGRRGLNFRNNKRWSEAAR